MVSCCCGASCRYTYTPEDVQRMILEKRSKGLGMRNMALEKARLQRQLDSALDNGQLEDAEMCAAAAGNLGILDLVVV